MRKAVLFLVLLLFVTSPVYGARYIQCNSVTVGTVTYDKPARHEGGCHDLRLCDGLNEQGMKAGVFRAVGTEWNDASNSTAKCNLSASAGDRIEELTAQEQNDIQSHQTNQSDLATRSQAKQRFDGNTPDGQSLRCFANIMMKEINIARKWTSDFKSEVANTVSLADFKVRVATLPELNPRTLSQLKNAMQQCIDDGDVDE